MNILKRWIQDAQISYMTGVALLSIGAEIRLAHPESAKEYYEEALKIFRHLRHKSFEPIMLSELGHVARTTGKTAEAKELYRQSLRHFHDQGHRPAIAHELECFAFLAIAEEEPQRAANLFGAAEALRERIKASMQYLEHLEYDDALVRLRSMLTEAELDSLWTEGRALSIEQAIKFALS
jgi:tetratricopeptide (TPR) repeat protein